MSSPRISLLAVLLLILPGCSLITNNLSPQSPTTGMVMSGDTLSGSVMTGVVSSGTDSQTGLIDVSTGSINTGAIGTDTGATASQQSLSSEQSSQSSTDDQLIKTPNPNGGIDIFVKQFGFTFTIDVTDRARSETQEGKKKTEEILLKQCSDGTSIQNSKLVIGEDQSITLFSLRGRTLERAIKEDILSKYPNCLIRENSGSIYLDAPIDYKLYDDMGKLSDAIAQYCPIQYKILGGVTSFRKINENYYGFLMIGQSAACSERRNTIK